MNGHELAFYLSMQDAIIKAYRPVEGATGVVANGHPLSTLTLAHEAEPDVRSSQADAHCGAVHTLAVCSGYLCSAGGDAMIRIWNAESLALFR